MTKKRLQQYRVLKDEAYQLRQQLKELETVMYYPRLQQGNGMPASHSGANVQEGLVLRHAELEELLQKKLEEIMAEQIAIEEAIQILEPSMRMLMRARYLDGLTWENVCCVIGYSWTQTHVLHSRALQKLAEIEDYE